MATNNLYKKYQKEIVPALQAELKLKNPMAVPRLIRVVLNAGVGRDVKQAGFIETVEKTLTRITGQKAMRTRAKRAISNFKIRENQEIGVMCTLRGTRMYDFLEKLVKVTFPRVRDFRGIPANSFDRQGNYTIGFKEQVAFPEVKIDELDKIHGLQIIINTTATTPAAAKALLVHLGFPFAKDK